MISNLENELVVFLPKAKEIFIASALVNQWGYNVIKNNTPTNCLCNYVVGIDLPSNPAVLDEMMNLNTKGKIKARIYSSERVYHPKVYIIKATDNSLCAFVGSANTTTGGLSRNIEMTVKIEDQEQCKKLIKWFDELFNKSAEITKDFLDKYKIAFKKIKNNQAIVNSNIKNITKSIQKATQVTLANLQGQFFKKNHFDAYDQKNHKDYSDAANGNRKIVRDRLVKLHHLIYLKFISYGLNKLNKHYHTPNIVSSHIYRKNFNQASLESIWLHYGYSEPEIPNGSSFLNHPRIQVILRWNYIGIWLVVGKDRASYEERRNIREKLTNSDVFRELFYQKIINLGGSYWIGIGGNKMPVGNIIDADHLSQFAQNDNYLDYYIIRRDYSPTDPALSEEIIVETVLLEFQRLYPVYKLFHL